MSSIQNIVVIGGGAAGIFTAINIAKASKAYRVVVLEKTGKLLSKVKVSGGGRCNVTNARSEPSQLINYYPRGGKQLYALFKRFSSKDMVRWLEERAIDIKEEEDLRMFPASNSSQTVIDCFLKEAVKYQVDIQLNQSVLSLNKKADQWVITTNDKEYVADKVIMATGSSKAAWGLLEKVGLKTSPPVPSLFTFNIKDRRIEGLQGVSFDHVSVKITKTKLQEEGPLLITHWGMSGPAVLKLSSVGAIHLHTCNYRFEVMLNYLGTITGDEARDQLFSYKEEHLNRTVIKYPLWNIPRRFWERILHLIDLPTETTFGELSKKHRNRLIEELTQGRYAVDGKSTFKDEFVTAGGVELGEVDLDTFECKHFKGLYLAGEVLNIDALTGGFNFQACWSEGWTIAQAINS
jgi:predicted Rossmann fold flavoprotein